MNIFISMERRGETPPSEEDVDYFGLYYACKNTLGEFALYDKLQCFAARGRVGLTPLYWNRKKLIFSFSNENGDPSLEEFPEGHLYNAHLDRLVCWDPLYFDKPFGQVKLEESIQVIRKLLDDAVKLRVENCDALLLSEGAGSIVLDSFIDPEKLESYSIFFSNDIDACIEYNEEQNRTMIFVNKCYSSDTIENSLMHTLARFLKNHTNHRKFLCGLGCRDLFSDDEDQDFKPRIDHVVKNFSKFGLEVSSPFFDSRLMEYVLDMTDRKNRPKILEALMGL